MLVHDLPVALDPANQNNFIRIGRVDASQQRIVPMIVIDNLPLADGNIVAKVIFQKGGMQPVESFNLGP